MWLDDGETITVGPVPEDPLGALRGHGRGERLTEHLLADAIIAAFALRGDAVLMHKDPELDALAGLVPMEALPYK